MISKFKELKSNLISTDIYIIIIVLINSGLTFTLFAKIQAPLLILSSNIGIVLLIAFSSTNKMSELLKSRLLLVKLLYIIPIIFIIYDQTQIFIRIINPKLFDDILIEWDHYIFGFNPTDAMEQLYHPLLTEYVQFSYMTFFLAPLVHCIEMYINKRFNEFNSVARLITFAFFFSYLLYYFMPAVGPRFTLYEFENLNSEIPGLWLADFFRYIINSGGGITDNSVPAALLVNRDCMPSGHTMMTLANLYLAWKHRSKLRFIFYIIGFSLIFSTVYLRYHYVVDLIAGAFFAAVAIYLEPKINRLINRKNSD